MRTIVVGVIASVCTALSLGLPACDGDQPGPSGGDAGDAGESSQGGDGSGGSSGSEGGGEAGAPGVGGTGQGGEPGSGGSSGGRSGNGGSGGSGANGGTTGGGGTAQGGDGGNEGGSGGSGEPDQLTICLRLMRAGTLSFDTTLAYEEALIADCRVNWTTTLYFDPSINLMVRDEFLNNLIAWNLSLWDCNPTAPTEFSLIYEPAPLTSADARALIDIYVEAASSLLSMSPPEIEEMRALLDRLSQQTIDRVSDEYSNPDCAGGAGGGSG
jgi:hypothetical protein